jgi:steroid Delta-isomerase
MYAADARFKDPFNEVRGIEPIQRIFAHMFVALHEPRFVVTEVVQQGDKCFLTWDFIFRFKRFDTQTTQTVRGASHLVFDAEGLVTLHRDYWDAAEELYEKLPVVGGLMRWLKKRANT